MTLVLAGVLGAIIGSFLNVVIHRVPRGGSLVAPPSTCPRCGVAVGGRDNVPIVSYLVLRGRCRSCGGSISGRYPLIELASAGAFVAAVWRFELGELAAFVAAACSVLLVLGVIDLEHRRVPNVIVVPGTVAAIVWVGAAAAVTGSWRTIVLPLATGSAAFALFLLIALVSGGMGFGDVKLAAFVGVVCGRFGWEVGVLAVFGSFVVGGTVAAALLIIGRRGRKDALPFAPSLAAGAIGALFAGPDPVRAWLGL